jgi:hypothetical protein
MAQFKNGDRVKAKTAVEGVFPFRPNCPGSEYVLDNGFWAPLSITLPVPFFSIKKQKARVLLEKFIREYCQEQFLYVK